MENKMIQIQLDNGTIIPLYKKSLLILPADCQIKHIINKEDDYDVIMIIAGIDRTVNIELHQPAIIIVEAGIKTTVNVTGGMALPLSQAVFIAGVDNVVNGLTNQNKGRIISAHRDEFDLGSISDFYKIEIKHFEIQPMSKVTLTVQPITPGNYRFGLNQKGRSLIMSEASKAKIIHLELQKLNFDKKYCIQYEANLTYRNHGNLVHAEISDWISERINSSVLHLRDRLSFDFKIENNGKLHKYVLSED